MARQHPHLPRTTQYRPGEAGPDALVLKADYVVICEFTASMNRCDVMDSVSQ